MQRSKLKFKWIVKNDHHSAFANLQLNIVLLMMSLDIYMHRHAHIMGFSMLNASADLLYLTVVQKERI